MSHVCMLAKMHNAADSPSRVCSEREKKLAGRLVNSGLILLSVEEN